MLLWKQGKLHGSSLSLLPAEKWPPGPFVLRPRAGFSAGVIQHRFVHLHHFIASGDPALTGLLIGLCTALHGGLCPNGDRKRESTFRLLLLKAEQWGKWREADGRYSKATDREFKVELGSQLKSGPCERVLLFFPLRSNFCSSCVSLPFPSLSLVSVDLAPLHVQRDSRGS